MIRFEHCPDSSKRSSKTGIGDFQISYGSCCQAITNWRLKEHAFFFKYFLRMRTTASTYWRRTVYLVSSTFIFIHHCTFKRVEVQIVAYACYYPLVGNDSVFTPTPHLFIIYLITIICHCQKWNGVFPFNCRANLWKMWLFSFVRASWWYHSFLSSLEPYCYVLWFFSSMFSSVIIKILFCNLSKFLLLGKVIRMSRQLSDGSRFRFSVSQFSFTTYSTLSLSISSHWS
jgi:hypothetical protein